MRIFEVKNNLIKLFFEESEKLFLSGFLMVKDARETYIAQIVHIETNKHGNVAIANLIYNVTPDGNLVLFEGTVPSTNSVIALLNTSDIARLLETENSITIGDLTQEDVPLRVDFNFIKNKLLILSENQDNSDVIVKKLNEQAKVYNKRTVIIDTVGTYEKTDNTLIAGKNFKLPVNYETLGFISDYGIDYKNPKSKAIIQETFLELQYYAKTLESQYIPVTNLIDILEDQYKTSNLLELILIKNALLKYHEDGVLAESKKDFINLNKSLIENSTTVIDISHVEDRLQREYMSFIYNKIAKMNEEVIVFVGISNGNSDKKLLKQLYFTKNINTVAVLPYAYKYLNELKKISKNLILFAPTMMQDDFESYNAFLHKIAKWEYIAYGKETQYLPLIVSIKAEKGIFNDTLTVSDVSENATSDFFKGQMKELVQKQYNDVLSKEQETRFQKQLKEQNQMQRQMMMQNQMQQLSQRQMEQQYMPQYNYSPAYVQQVQTQQPYYNNGYGMPQMMPPQMPQYGMPMQNYAMPMQMPQQMPPYGMPMQNPMMAQPQQQMQSQDVQTVPQNFEMEQLDKLYSNSSLEDAFKGIQPQPSKNVVQKPTEKVEKVAKVEKVEEPVVQVVEEKVQPMPQQLPPQIEEDEEEDIYTGDLTEADLDAISEVEVELHEEEQRAMLEAEEPQVQIKNSFEFVEEETKDTIPVYPLPELQNSSLSKREFVKGDRVKHAKFGVGVVEKVINYGSKKLCSIYFEEHGRMLLAPTISELEKI